MDSAMPRIKLITMPAAPAHLPSISLKQLESATRKALGERVEIDVLHLNQDFALFAREKLPTGGDGREETLDDLLCGPRMFAAGIGDWFFRQAAFPEAPENSADYFKRYFPGRSPQAQSIKDAILAKRAQLPAFLEELVDRYALDRADLVGFTSMFHQTAASIAMARVLKRRRPELTTLIGGPNCEPPMGTQLARHVDCLDYVFAGPALISFPQFVERWIEGDRASAGKLEGVLGPNFDESRAGTVGPELGLDVDLPLDYDDFFDLYEANFPQASEEPTVLFETSRGCWWGEKAHCTFCGLNGSTMAYRSMPPAQALEHIQSLMDRYGSRTTQFKSVDNIIPTEYLEEVFPKLKPSPGAEIFYEVKADLSDGELETLSRAGVTKLQPGIEAMATSTLKLMKKGTTVFVNLQFLKSCLRHGVRPYWNLLVGFPGEGADVYEKYTNDLARLTHLSPPDGAFPVRFDRYSPYFVKAAEYGLQLRSFDCYRLTYPFPAEALEQLAYYFQDKNYEASHFTLLIDWLAPMRETVGAWLARWRDRDNGNVPKLYLEPAGEAAIVHDSRNGRGSYEITPARKRLLEFLDKPRRLSELETFCREETLDQEEELAFLDEHQLVWEEKGKRLSLVLLNAY